MLVITPDGDGQHHVLWVYNDNNEDLTKEATKGKVEGIGHWSAMGHKGSDK